MRIQNSQLVAAKVSKLEFRGKEGKFPRHFKGLFQLGMCEFDPSLRENEQGPRRKARQWRASASWRPVLSLQFCAFPSEIAVNLRQTFEKLPFLGDCGRRPGSICTTWPSLQCKPRSSPPRSPSNWECRVRITVLKVSSVRIPLAPPAWPKSCTRLNVRPTLRNC